jgi:P27 family predicted phage terminase small subunit
LDLLKASDTAVLASYCVAYSRWIVSEAALSKESTVIKVEGSQGQIKFVKNPMFMVSSEAQKQMLRAGSLLGFNAADRSKVSSTPTSPPKT